jgi:hypothetical protein
VLSRLGSDEGERSLRWVAVCRGNITVLVGPLSPVGELLFQVGLFREAENL